MQRIPPRAALTYARMVRRQHATPELQHLLTHRKRIRVPSKRRVRLSKVVHGRACASKSITKKPIPSELQHRMQRIPPRAALTYVRMVRRQNATPELQHLLKQRKRIRVPSKRRVRLSKVIHGRACTSKSNKKTSPLSIVTSHATHPSPRSPHLCQDGSQAARDAGTPAAAHPSQAHPRAFQALCTSQQGCSWPCLRVKIKQKKTVPSQSQHRMQRIPPRAALTYVRMVRRQHATLELQHLLKQRKRIRVPSKLRVRLSKVVHGCACASKSITKKPIPSELQHRMQRIPPRAALTYVRMARRQHATPELQHLLNHRKRIRMPSKRRVRLSKVVHGRACTSKSNKKPIPSQSSHRVQRIPPRAALTYVRMVRRQHATLELQHLLTHRKRIRVPSKRSVRRSKVVHDRACASKSITKTNPLSIVTSRATHPSPRSPHLCQDGSQAARDAGTPALAHPSQAHPRAFQAHSTSEQGCSWPCLHVKVKQKTSPLSIVTSHATHPSPRSPHLCQDGSQAARDAETPAPAHPSQAHPHAFQALCTSQQGCSWPCLRVKVNHKKTNPL
jgi:hypothetical protein